MTSTTDQRAVAAAMQLRDLARLGVRLPSDFGGLELLSPFVGPPTAPLGSTPMLEVLGTGRAWQRATRLKVYLLLNWLRSNVPASRRKDEVAFDAQLAAAAIGLSASSGKSDVNQAVADLIRTGYIAEADDGPSRGQKRYAIVIEDAKVLERGDPEARNIGVVKLGNSFVTKGFLASMPGREIATILVFAYMDQVEDGSRPDHPWRWTPAEPGASLCGVSAHTLHEGCRLLVRRQFMREYRYRVGGDIPGRRRPIYYRFASTPIWLHGLNRMPDDQRRADGRPRMTSLLDDGVRTHGGTEASADDPWAYDEPF